MSEVVGIAAAVLAIAQLANSFAKVIISLSNASKSLKDDRYDELYWRMFAEKQSMIALSTHIETSGRPLSPENIKNFESLLAQLKISHAMMDNSLRRLLPEEGGSTLRSVANRLKFDRGGFEELKQLMSSIEAMTRALKLLGETLPGYTPRTTEQQSSAAPTISRATMATDRPSLEATSLPDYADEGPQNQPLSQQERGSPDIPLSSLSRMCEEAMMELYVHPRLGRVEPWISGLLARFELWSLGVWGSRERVMDQILEADPERHEVVAMFVARSLANVAVALENIFRAIRNSDPSNAEQSFSRSRRVLLAALGTGSLVDIAIQRWSVLAMSLEDEETVTTDADVTESSGTAPTPSAMAGERVDAAIDSALADVGITLESLFSINSSIHPIRRSYRLDMESALENTRVAVGSTVGVEADTIGSEEQYTPREKQKEYLVLRVVSKDKAAHRLTREEIVQLVKRLEEALDSDETSAANPAGPGASSDMRLLAPEVKTHRLKLEEFEKQSTDIAPEKLNITVRLNQRLKKTLDTVVVGGNRDVFGNSKQQLQATWETDKILDRTVETLGNVVTSITQ